MMRATATAPTPDPSTSAARGRPAAAAVGGRSCTDAPIGDAAPGTASSDPGATTADTLGMLGSACSVSWQEQRRNPREGGSAITTAVSDPAFLTVSLPRSTIGPACAPAVPLPRQRDSHLADDRTVTPQHRELQPDCVSRHRRGPTSLHGGGRPRRRARCATTSAACGTRAPDGSARSGATRTDARRSADWTSLPRRGR